MKIIKFLAVYLATVPALAFADANCSEIQSWIDINMVYANQTCQHFYCYPYEGECPFHGAFIASSGNWVSVRCRFTRPSNGEEVIWRVSKPGTSDMVYCAEPYVSPGAPVSGNSTVGDVTPISRHPSCQSGSILNIKEQSIGEVIPLKNLSYSLSYQSRNDWRRKQSRIVNASYAFQAGNTISHRITVRSGFTQLAQTSSSTVNPISISYYLPTSLISPTQIVNRINFEVELERIYVSGFNEYPGREELTSKTVSIYNPDVWGLGGWTLTNHHYYDVQEKTIYLGTGFRRYGELPTISDSVYGTVFIGMDEKGREVYLFDSNGVHLETKTALMGVTLYKFEYLVDKKISAVIDRDNRRVEFIRSAGALTAIQDSFGTQTLVENYSNGRLKKVTAPGGAYYDLSYNYNPPPGSPDSPDLTQNYLLTEIRYPSGLISMFEYDVNGLFVGETKSDGSVLRVFLDIVDGVTQFTTRTAELVLSKVKSTFSGVDESTTNLNSQNAIVGQSSLTSSVETRSDAAFDISSTYGSDIRFGNLLRFPSAITKVSKGESNISTSISQTQSVSYISGSGPFNVNQLQKQIIINGNSSQWSFNGTSKTLSITSPLGVISTAVLDSKERLVSYATPGSLPISFAYNSQGQLIQVRKGHSYVNYSYGGTQYLSTETNELGQTITYDVDAAGNTISKQYPYGETTLFEYSPAGKIKKVKLNGDHIFEFGLADQILSYLPPILGGVEAKKVFQYDNDHRLIKIQTAAGKVANFHRISGENTIDSISTSAGDYVFGSLDLAGRPGYISSPGGVRLDLGWTGRKLLRQSYFNDLIGIGEILYEYDTFLRLKKVILPGGVVVNYSYNSDGDLIQAGDEVYTTTLSTVPSVAGDGTPQMVGTKLVESVLDGKTKTIVTTSENYLADPNAPTWSQHFSYEFRNASNDISTLITANQETKRNRDSKFTVDKKSFDSTGTVIGRNETQFEFSLDARGRLVQAQKTANKLVDGQMSYGSPEMGTYSFLGGPNSNITAYTHGAKSTTAQYNSQDQLTKLVGSVNRDLAYNADGDLASVSNCFGVKAFNYDVFGNLRSVSLPNGKMVSYKIDGFNRRFAKIVNGVVEEYYLWYNQTKLAAVISADGLHKTLYVYGGHPIAPAYLIKDGEKFKVVADQRGSIVAVVNADGVIVQNVEYDEYGARLRDSSVTSPGAKPFQPLGFASGLFDQDTELIRFGVRDYDPLIGRWTSRDPAIFAGGEPNLYAYASGNPLNFVDPTGFWSATLGIAATGIFGAGYEAGAGVYVGTNNNGALDFGFYGSAGFGFGLNGGVGLQSSISPLGTTSSLSGASENASIGIGALGVTTSTADVCDSSATRSAGYSTGRFGASVSHSNAVTFGIWDLINSIRSINGQEPLQAL